MEKLYGTYAPSSDMTFIIRDIVDEDTDDVKSTEVVGFVFGDYSQDMDMLKKFEGKLKAEFY